MKTKPTHRRATNLNIQVTPDCVDQDSTASCEGFGSSPSPFLRERGRGEGSPLRLSTLLLLLVLGVLTPLHSESVVLFKTGFEAIEGYDPQFNLVGQRGWTAEGSGGNGLITQIEGLGQQAYIGFTGPTNQDDFTTIFKPISFQPVPGSDGIIKFSVLMQIVPSTNGFDDDFRWSVYNNDESPVRLLTIDFEGKNEVTGDIAVILEDNTVLATGYEFGYDGFYTLTLWTDVKRNLWSAYLNDFVIVNSQPITTKGTAISVGDIDAVWFLHDAAHPGDNYMVFDNYTISVEDVTSIPALIENFGKDAQGFFGFTVQGEAGLKYSVEVTSDFIRWFSLGTFPAPASGAFTFQDTTSSDFTPRILPRSAGGISSTLA